MAARAIPAYPWPFEVKQPDGTTLTIQMQGDEHGYLAMTDDGYPIVQNTTTGYYEYARLATRGIEPSGIVATPASRRDAQAVAYLQQLDIAAMQQHVARHRTARRARQQVPSQFLINDFPTTGTQRSLVILVQFDDVKFTSVDDPYEYYYNMLNQEGFTHANGANGSARDFYHDCSNGQFDPQFDVVGPVTLSREQGYYGGDATNMLDTMAYRMVIEACELVDADVDFSQYDLNGDGVVDNIYFFYAGFGQADSGQGSTIWPHAGKLEQDWLQEMPQHDGVLINRYATSNEIRYGTGPMFKPVGIGTFVHEFGHVLGLVDHYDTGYGGSFHPNTWDTMAAASYNDNQNTPPTFSAFERGELGWLEYTDITPETMGLLSVSELMSSNSAYRLVVPGTEGKEFFVFENRQQQSWDRTLPGHGMLVWHIDQDWDIWQNNQANAAPNHQRIDIVEADKVQTTNSYGGDPFPGTQHVTTYDFYSWAHENLFSFDYVEETDTTVRFLLARTAYKPQAPTIDVQQVLGRSLTFTWGEVADAHSYLVTVEQLEAGGTATALEGYDRKPYSQPQVVRVDGLTPQCNYRITVVSKIASYQSEPAVAQVATTEIQFCETAPVATEATAVTATGFTAHWLPLDGAEAYSVSVYQNRYSDIITESYGCDNKADRLPEAWNTNSTQYSTILFGQSKPALQLSKQDDYIQFDYAGRQIVKLSFWQRSQMATNQLVVESRDSSDDEWTEVTTMAMSSRGEVVNLGIDSVAQVRIRFDRKGSYALLDDIEVGYITLDQSPVQGFTDLNGGDNLQLAISGLPHAGSYVYRVRGIRDSIQSAESNAVTVIMGEGVTGDVTGDGQLDIADVNAVINVMLGKAAPTNAADVTGDSRVDIADVNAVINLMLGK